MHRIDHATASADENGTGKDGFTGGDVARSIPATVVTPAWANAVQEELAGLAEFSGGELVKAENTQVQRAIFGQLDIMALCAVSSCGSAGGAVWSDAVLAMVTASGIDYPLLVLSNYATSNQIYTLDIGTTKFGSTLTARSLGGGSTNQLNGIAHSYSLQLFCAVGVGGEIQTSPDGTTWTARTAAGSYSGAFQSICWDETLGLFIAVGEGGEIQTSSDGTTWTARTADASFADTFADVESYNGTIIAVGDNSGAGEVQMSTDGITWTEVVTGASEAFLHCSATQWGFYAFSGDPANNLVEYSADAVTWSDVTSAVGFAATLVSPTGALASQAVLFKAAPYHGAPPRYTALGFTLATTMLRRCAGIWVFALGTTIYTSGLLGFD